MAQESTADLRVLLDKLITDENFLKADSAVNAQIENFKLKSQMDSLHYYPYYLGKIEQAKKSGQSGKKKAEDFVNYIRANSENGRTIYLSLLNLADFYDHIGEENLSLDVTSEALEISKTVLDIKLNESGKVKYNLGVCYNTQGDHTAAKSYFYQALRDYESSENPDYENLSNTYNALGAMMWLSSKLDSAKIYYSKSVESLEKNETDPIENLYLTAIINSNITLADYFQGDIASAITMQEKVVKDYQKVINRSTVALTKSKAEKNQINSISNLAVFYNEMGFMNRANQIINYAYQKRINLLEPNDPTLRQTLIQVAQSEISMKEFKQAIDHLDEALDGMKTYGDENNYWKGAALYAKAEAYIAIGKIEEARALYTESEKLFEVSVGEEYDREFLGFLRKKALFLAQNDDKEAAVKSAFKGFNYVSENGKELMIPYVKHFVNLAEVYFNIEDYENAKLWSLKGLEMIAEQNQNINAINALSLNFEKPALILLAVQSDFKLNNNLDEAFLKEKAKQIASAIEILNKRKKTTQSLEESKLLLDNYQRLYSFSKKINLELFKKTNESHYLKEILNVHESIIYSRIQSQFNYRNDIRFKNLPKEILEEEQEIKKMLITALEEPNPETGLKDYYESSKAWDAFNENLRINHPKYYELKYGFNQKSLAQMLERIPDNTSVVRYIFIDEKLYAFVLDQKNISLHPLTFDLDSRKIEALNEEVQDKIKSLKILHELYVELWEPFEDVLNTKRVTIVPDGNLFNLSFESLTRSFCDNFRDMKSESLIADYILSYNYSINLIDKNAITIDYGNNFIGFAPGFDDSMKERYQMTIQDSISIDKTYLTLLPQPHSLELTKDFSKHFNGSSYLNEKSTEQVFKERAKEHKIIHIGTHAESNNITPELSRLIFAKEITDSASSDDNSLYTFEIYNTNLSANLAILTACETGKPTYQAGEGMISLAHAFNYAGSESILTSLWKIDELSTAEIIHEFYNNISNGLDKDEALQKAKLSYLEKAEGREMDPEYWAGLVLIGDTSPIVIGSDSNSLWYWILGVVLIILLLYFLFRKKS